MHYFAKIKPIEGVFMVSFLDFPQIKTYGQNLNEALKHAEEALNGCLEADFERGFELPTVTKHSNKSAYAIPVAPHIAVAIQLRNMRSNRSQIEIARELGVSYQAYQRLENPRRCNPTLKTLEKIGRALNKKVNVILE